MSWTSILNNPQSIEAIYQGSPPDLTGVRVHEVALHQDGPTLRLRFDLPHYPTRPPQKWGAQGFNTMQVEISLSGLTSVTLDGFGTDVVADVSLRQNDGIEVIVTSPRARLQATAEVAFISQLSAYTNEPA
ncbi:Imm50 family immunity protein [Streptomyces naphthomycinicus]|uniref:Imm50 family immunity protein n=1 Tax=Streptomyces naphthomycinicus TaxID=2872625 RepID=UPI001CEC67B7|nr:Imm50 family immunity protein [Streptomyces sp. TML10]